MLTTVSPQNPVGFPAYQGGGFLKARSHRKNGKFYVLAAVVCFLVLIAVVVLLVLWGTGTFDKYKEDEPPTPTISYPYPPVPTPTPYPPAPAPPPVHYDVHIYGRLKILSYDYYEVNNNQAHYNKVVCAALRTALAGFDPQCTITGYSYGTYAQFVLVVEVPHGATSDYTKTLRDTIVCFDFTPSFSVDPSATEFLETSGRYEVYTGCIDRVYCRPNQQYPYGVGYNCPCPSGYFNSGTGCQAYPAPSPTPSPPPPPSGPVECPSGYQPDANNRCQDINECIRFPSPCGVNERCENLPGYFRCSCNIGYERDPFGQCIDVNPCTAATCKPNSQCVPDFNTQTYSCVCLPGYVMDASGYCAMIDACASNPCSGDPNKACFRWNGEFTCKCIAYNTEGVLCDQSIFGCQQTALYGSDGQTWNDIDFAADQPLVAMRVGVNSAYGYISYIQFKYGSWWAPMRGIADPLDVDRTVDVDADIYRVVAEGYEDPAQGIKRLVNIAFYDIGGNLIADFDSGAASNMGPYDMSMGSRLRFIAGRTALPKNPINSIDFHWDDAC